MSLFQFIFYDYEENITTAYIQISIYQMETNQILNKQQNHRRPYITISSLPYDCASWIPELDLDKYFIS